ncbi:unnamed protein product [Chrysoparadoxa australica]
MVPPSHLESGWSSPTFLLVALFSRSLHGVAHLSQLLASSPPPPLFYSLPLYSQDLMLCVIVDEDQDVHILKDKCPPHGGSLAACCIVDTPVGVIEDTICGTRFKMDDGSVRGRWCPTLLSGNILQKLWRWAQWGRSQPEALLSYPVIIGEDGVVMIELPDDDGEGALETPEKATFDGYSD